MKDFRLYAITGENYHPGRTVEAVMEAALKGGAEFVQLRDKRASKRELLEKAKMLRELTWRYGVPFVVNDHPDIALAVDADGVHLGQDDLPLSVARDVLGPDRIVGISTHSIEQARQAEKEGADYIGVGPVFPTGTKPGRTAVTTSYVRQAAKEIRIPFVAIGGITPANAGEVIAAGARRLCAVSTIVGSSDPEAACRKLLALLNRASAPLEGGERHPERRTVIVNGRREDTGASTLQELAQQFGLADKRVVAELDGTVVPRESWRETAIAHGASIEFVHFVGGG
jgi:thiamine-phosphate pyrophosphorylase